jgi:hypothetical protein
MVADLWANRDRLEIVWPETFIAPDGSQPGAKPLTADDAYRTLAAKLATTTEELTKARADLAAAKRDLAVAQQNAAMADGRATNEAREREQANRRHQIELAAVHDRYEADLRLVRAQHPQPVTDTPPPRAEA